MDVNGKVSRIVQPLPRIWPIINAKWPFKIDIPHFKSESLEHDIRLAEIFMKLEKLKCFRSFFTENLLQSSIVLAEDPRFHDMVKLQSDAALSIIDARGVLRTYAVELELSKKSPERYRQKFIGYYLARGIDGVLYISPEREIKALVARVDDEIRSDRDSIVHFAFESSVLATSSKLTFSNSQEVKIEFQ